MKRLMIVVAGGAGDGRHFTGCARAGQGHDPHRDAHFNCGRFDHAKKARDFKKFRENLLTSSGSASPEGAMQPLRWRRAKSMAALRHHSRLPTRCFNRMFQ